MAHLRMYKNGTVGGTDGVEIAAGSVLNLPGIYSGRSRIIPIYLRCDAGYQASGITITCTNCYVNVHNYSAYPVLYKLFETKDEIINYLSSINISQLQYDSGWFTSKVPADTVGNTNKLFFLRVDSPANEVDGDHTGASFSISFTETAV